MPITFLSAYRQFCVVMQRKVFDIMQDFVVQYGIKYFINLQKQMQIQGLPGCKVV